MDDLEADFLAIYRIEDPLDELSGPRFFKLAYRASAFQGVMAARISSEQSEEDQQNREHRYSGDETGIAAWNLTATRPGDSNPAITFASAPKGGN